ncbi:MAG: ORF6C domain-containing protein [Chloroflexota bacterium]|nr:ORF6C domain-containing protein [Chloroflexota bacterium]
MSNNDPSTGDVLESENTRVEQPTDQQIIPFVGDSLVAAMTDQGSIYISLPGMCTALGLDSRGQLQRIQRHEVLAAGLRRIPLATPGGRQLTYCLRVDALALWLAGAETKRIKAEFKAKIVAYQRELAPVATQVFLRVLGVPERSVARAGDPRLIALAQQYDNIMAVAAFLRDHMDSIQAQTHQVANVTVRLEEVAAVFEQLAAQQQQLQVRQDATEDRLAHVDERTAQLTPAHKRQVQLLVEQMVKSTQAGPRPLQYSSIYWGIKNRFNVTNYGEVADEAFDNLMGYLRDELRRVTSGGAPRQEPLF